MGAKLLQIVTDRYVGRKLNLAYNSIAGYIFLSYHSDHITHLPKYLNLIIINSEQPSYWLSANATYHPWEENYSTTRVLSFVLAAILYKPCKPLKYFIKFYSKFRFVVYEYMYIHMLQFYKLKIFIVLIFQLIMYFFYYMQTYFRFCFFFSNFKLYI